MLLQVPTAAPVTARANYRIQHQGHLLGSLRSQRTLQFLVCLPDVHRRLINLPRANHTVKASSLGPALRPLFRPSENSPPHGPAGTANAHLEVPTQPAPPRSPPGPNTHGRNGSHTAHPARPAVGRTQPGLPTSPFRRSAAPTPGLGAHLETEPPTDRSRTVATAPAGGDTEGASPEEETLTSLDPITALGGAGCNVRTEPPHRQKAVALADLTRIRARAGNDRAPAPSAALGTRSSLRRLCLPPLRTARAGQILRRFHLQLRSQGRLPKAPGRRLCKNLLSVVHSDSFDAEEHAGFPKG